MFSMMRYNIIDNIKRSLQPMRFLCCAFQLLCGQQCGAGEFILRCFLEEYNYSYSCIEEVKLIKFVTEYFRILTSCKKNIIMIISVKTRLMLLSTTSGPVLSISIQYKIEYDFKWILKCGRETTSSSTHTKFLLKSFQDISQKMYIIGNLLKFLLPFL